MKKTLKLFACLAFCLILAGCSSKKEESTTTKKTTDFSKIESSLLNSSYFSNHETVNKSTIEKKYSIDLSGATNVLMITSKDYDDASMVLIADKSVKSEIDSFVDSYNDQWVKMNYFPEQAELVKKATYKTSGDFVIYIVSSDNENVLKLINL